MFCFDFGVYSTEYFHKATTQLQYECVENALTLYYKYYEF